MRLDVPSSRIKVRIPRLRVVYWLGNKHVGGTPLPVSLGQNNSLKKQIPMYHSTWHHIAEGHSHKVSVIVLEQWKKQN
jgi:hypothetical protein